MSSRRRLHREDPVRAEPIRNWSALYRRSDSWGPHNSSASPKSTDGGTQDGSWNDAVAQGVKLGYRVVEEHIHQGQRVAQQINSRSYGPGAMGNDIRELVERMVRYSADLASLWLDLMGSIAGNPDLIGNLFGSGQGKSESAASAGPANAASVNGATAVSIEIVSTRSTQVALDLRSPCQGRSLVTHGLHALDTEKPPLSNITFKPGSDNGLAGLRICLPEGQPPGLYTGVIIDQETGQPQGTLSVRIAD